MKMESKGLTQSLCKAFEILACFTPESPVLRVVDITRKVDLTQSNVSRLVNTMVACGYLERLEDSGYFQLGKQIISLSSVALNLTGGSDYAGAVKATGSATVKLENGSSWTLTGDSTLSSFEGDLANVNLNGFTLYINGVAVR